MGYRVPIFTHYEQGTCNTIDDVSGFKVKLSDTQEQWNGVVTTDEFFNERHPQEFPITPRPEQIYQNSRSEIEPVFANDSYSGDDL